MADVLSTKADGKALFPADLVTEMINTVKGKSSLAKLSASEPVPFTGKTMFQFSLDKEMDVVAENGAKTKGGMTVLPVSMQHINPLSDCARKSALFTESSLITMAQKTEHLLCTGCSRRRRVRGSNYGRRMNPDRLSVIFWRQWAKTRKRRRKRH